MAEFKKLSDVEVVAEPTESANVLIEENGVIKKAPKTAVGGAGTGNFVVISMPYIEEADIDTFSIIEGAVCNKTYDEVVEMYCANEIDGVILKANDEWECIFSMGAGMGLLNADGLVDISDANSAECVGFTFFNPYGSITELYYYRNGLSYDSPVSGPV